MTKKLGSWTRTLNVEDAMTLLEESEPGISQDAWHEQGDRLLPQPSRPRRRETLRMVASELLDWENGVLLDTAFLRLFKEGTAHRRQTLFNGRLLSRKDWVLKSLGELVLPQLERTHESLAPPDIDLISDESWHVFIRRHADIPDSAFVKTRSTIHRNLSALGVLSIDKRTTRVRHAEPDPVAFGWLLAYEMMTSGRSEAVQSWARVDALPTKLFAVLPEYADRCIDVAVEVGLLRRGFLAGMTRLHVGEAYS